MRPSSIISRVRKLFPSIYETSNILPPDTNAEALDQIASGNTVFRRLTAALRQKADGWYLWIIDYKSGSRDFKLSNVYYGLQLQLITYMDTIWENTGAETPFLPGGMLYFKVDDPIIRYDGKISEEEIEKAIMKQLRMKGLLLADVKLIREMDHEMEGASSILPVTVNKGDVIGKNSSVATMEQFKLLRKYVRQLLKDLSREIMQGTVAINPAKNRDGTACRYCSYLSVCQFDTAMQDNTYRLLYEKDNEEVWKLLADSMKKEKPYDRT